MSMFEVLLFGAVTFWIGFMLPAVGAAMAQYFHDRQAEAVVKQQRLDAIESFRYALTTKPGRHDCGKANRRA